MNFGELFRSVRETLRIEKNLMSAYLSGDGSASSVEYLDWIESGSVHPSAQELVRLQILAAANGSEAMSHITRFFQEQTK